jgi:hypothetical protein
MGTMTEAQEVLLEIRTVMDQTGADLEKIDRIAGIAETLLAGGIQGMGDTLMALSMIAQRYPMLFPRTFPVLDDALEAVGLDLDDFQRAIENIESS